jgi:hypothetical protein
VLLLSEVIGFAGDVESQQVLVGTIPASTHLQGQQQQLGRRRNVLVFFFFLSRQ